MLALTVASDESDVASAIVAGACGYLLKDSPIDDVVEAVRAAARGVAWLSPRAAEALLDRIRRDYVEPSAAAELEQELSPRELEVLQLVARGLDNGEIAAELSISPRTAKNHVSSILSKLEVPEPDPGRDLRRPQRPGLTDTFRRRDRQAIGRLGDRTSPASSSCGSLEPSTRVVGLGHVSAVGREPSGRSRS